MTGYHDYLIVLTPTADVVEKVKNLKEISASLIGDFESRYSKAHITIQNWPRKKPAWIDPLLPKLERELLRLPSLSININGFDKFLTDDNATIYAKLEQTPGTQVWFKQVKRFFAGSKITPHITIARGLSKTDFALLWPHFKNMEWKQEIKIEKLTLLRREMISHDPSFHLFKELTFNSKIDFNTYEKSRLKSSTNGAKPKNDDQFSLF